MEINEAIEKIKWRIETASAIAGKGTDGNAFQDLEMAIEALKTKQKIIDILRDPVQSEGECVTEIINAIFGRGNK